MNGLAAYYVSTIGKPHEYFDLTTIANRSTDEIVVELRPPDEPKVRHALALTLAELNALGGRTFGDGQRLTFALKS